MKILQINNTFNLNKNNNIKPSFNGRSGRMTKCYIATDSYVDETGLHFARNRVLYPWAEQSEIAVKMQQQREPENLKEKIFLTQKQADATEAFTYVKQEKKAVEKALYDLDLEKVNRYIRSLNDTDRCKIVAQPFFALGLADIPLTEQNKESYRSLLNYSMRRTLGTVNVMDENGITLLEKVMNAENEPYLDTIRLICRRRGNSEFPSGIAYEPMQKYAFDGIQNSDFKEKCKNLPIKFFDIIEDVKNKDLLSLDKHIQEQMSCGFCDLQYAIRYSLDLPAQNFGKNYAKMVLDIAKKHVPDDVGLYMLRKF